MRLALAAVAQEEAEEPEPGDGRVRVLEHLEDLIGVHLRGGDADVLVVGVAEFLEGVGGDRPVGRIEVLEEVVQPGRHVLVLQVDRPLQVLGDLAVGRDRLAAIRVELALVDLAEDRCLDLFLGPAGRSGAG